MFDVAEFQERGFSIVPGFLTRQRVDVLLKELNEICRGNTLAEHDENLVEMEPEQLQDGDHVRRVYEPCSHNALFRQFSEDERLLDCVEQVFGPNLCFHYSKINMKPPEIGSIVEWHQDLTYYPLTNTDSLAVLFYLDDTTVENGCLRLLPGCHRQPLFKHTRNGYFQGKIVENLDESRAVNAEGEAGTAIFMHGLTPHASATNRSSLPRRTLILSYRAADAMPLYFGPNTVRSENQSRLVRGELPRMARFTLKEFPIPRYREPASSLYKLQEQTRRVAAEETPSGK